MCVYNFRERSYKVKFMVVGRLLENGLLKNSLVKLA